MSIIREEIAINFQPYPKTNVRCPVAACTFFAEHPYDAELGNLNRATDFALRAVEMHLIQHRVHVNLDVGAGPGHDLGGEERLGQPTVPRDNPQPAEEQINTGVFAANLRLSIFRRGQFFFVQFCQHLLVEIC